MFCANQKMEKKNRSGRPKTAKNGQKWAKMAKNGRRRPKMDAKMDVFVKKKCPEERFLDKKMSWKTQPDTKTCIFFGNGLFLGKVQNRPFCSFFSFFGHAKNSGSLPGLFTKIGVFDKN